MLQTVSAETDRRWSTCFQCPLRDTGRQPSIAVSGGGLLDQQSCIQQNGFRFTSSKEKKNQQKPARRHPNHSTHKASNITSSSNNLPSPPQPQNRNRNTPSISRRTRISQFITLNRQIQRNVQRASFEKAERHAVHVFGWDLSDVAGDLRMLVRGLVNCNVFGGGGGGGAGAGGLGIGIGGWRTNEP